MFGIRVHGQHDTSAYPQKPLVTKPCCQHRRWPLAHGIDRQGRQRARLTVDAVRSQPAGRRPGGEDEIARRVETEGTGDRFGRDVPDARQMPGDGVDGEPRDAVVAAVGHIQELPRSREVNLGAGVPGGVPVRQGRDGTVNLASAD
jgi:hypothetical protein